MTPELTDEQREAIQAHPGSVVYLIDAQTQKEYALIPAETYQKLRFLFDPDEELNAEGMYPLVDEAWRPILEDSSPPP